ncbi:MAG: DUF1122 family protein [Candidatus Hadarchaeaceae archaeon]
MLEASLSGLNGKKLDGYSVKMGKTSAGRYPEAVNFELYLVDQEGESCDNPVVWGTFFGGRGEAYKPWIEIYFREEAAFKSSGTLKLAEAGVDEAFFRALVELIPPGGHIMVVYLDHEETRKGLEQGVPAPATPIGHLLWKSGCTWFKDWYFAEGFREGDVKLQGDKPTNEENRRKDLLEIHQALYEFLRKEKSENELFARARERAKEIMASINRTHVGVPKK